MQAEEAEAEAQAEEVRLAPMERGEWRGVRIIESARPKSMMAPSDRPPQPTEMAMAVRWAVLFPGQTLHDLGLE